MSTFEVTIPELNSLKTAFRRYPKISEPILQKAVDASQAILAKHTTRGNLPWRTGNLVHSFRFQRGRLQARWFPTTRYASYVHTGTGIYGPKGMVIVPTTKKALYWQGANHPVKSVKGQRPNPFMPRIVNTSQNDITKLFGQALQLVNREIASQVRKF